MKQNKEKIAQGLINYSYVSEEIIGKAVAGDNEALFSIYEKYKEYVRYTIKKTARKEGVRLDKILMEEIEQQVWKGLVEDIKKFKI